MRYLVEIDTKAVREIRSLRKDEQRRVLQRIGELAGDPRPPGCVKLSGASRLWRIRVGDYRIIYRIDEGRLCVLIVRLGHRRDAYRGL